MDPHESGEPEEWLDAAEAESMEDLLAGFADLDDACSLEDLSQAYAQLLADQERLTESLGGTSVGLNSPLSGAGAGRPGEGTADEGEQLSTKKRTSEAFGSREAVTDRTSTAETPTAGDEERRAATSPAAALGDLRRLMASAAGPDVVDRVAITPVRILEALLFVGTPDNTPLSGRQLAALMRGVSPEEIEAYVDQLNVQYAAEGAAYAIVKETAGYRLELSATHAAMRNRFYGQVREVKLAQPVIDVLALVAYHQPVSKREIEKLMGGPCSGSLNQLLRRNLISLTKEPAPVGAVYRTTSRFLDLFDLESLDDLPRSESWES